MICKWCGMFCSVSSSTRCVPPGYVSNNSTLHSLCTIVSGMVDTHTHTDSVESQGPPRHAFICGMLLFMFSHIDPGFELSTLLERGGRWQLSSRTFIIPLLLTSGHLYAVVLYQVSLNYAFGKLPSLLHDVTPYTGVRSLSCVTDYLQYILN